MEEQDNSSTDIAVVEEREIVKRGPYKKTKKKTTFLKPKGHDLDKAIKQSGRYLETALRALVHVATDEKADPQVKRMAAKDILEAHYKMVDQRDKDEIARLEKEIDKMGLVGGGSTEEEDDDTPQLDFDNIHPDFADDQSAEDVEFEEKN